MKTAENIFIFIHVASVVGMLVLLLTQTAKPEKVLSKGFMHAAMTALVAGFALIGINSALDNKINHLTIGIKFLVLMVIMVLGYQNQNKPKISNKVWASMLGLTIFNVVIAISM